MKKIILVIGLLIAMTGIAQAGGRLYCASGSSLEETESNLKNKIENDLSDKSELGNSWGKLIPTAGSWAERNKKVNVDYSISNPSVVYAEGRGNFYICVTAVRADDAACDKK